MTPLLSWIHCQRNLIVTAPLLCSCFATILPCGRLQMAAIPKLPPGARLPRTERKQQLPQRLDLMLPAPQKQEKNLQSLHPRLRPKHMGRVLAISKFCKRRLSDVVVKYTKAFINQCRAILWIWFSFHLATHVMDFVSTERTFS